MDIARDLLEFERPLVASGHLVVGIDEVGRGALAGPLVVGAVAIDALRPPPHGLNDSKMLTIRQRVALVEPIEEWALASSLGWVSAQEIDEWGISHSLTIAAHRALSGLTCTPTYALIDGTVNLLRGHSNLFDTTDDDMADRAEVTCTLLVKGDQRSAVIAAASVLAKVRRDAYMVRIHDEWAMYGWKSNKGYGAQQHLRAISEHGISPFHRQSWRLPTGTTVTE